MAKITYSGLITNITGHIGGMTFQRNSSGYIVRKSPAGKRTGNASQLNSKSSFSSFGKSYQNLTNAQKTGWNNLAASFAFTDRWSEVKVLKGVSLFQLISPFYELINAAQIVAAPALVVSPVFDAFTVTLGANSINLQWAAAQIQANQSLVVYASPPVASSQVIPRKLMRLVSFLSASPINSHDIGIEWEALYGLNVTNDLITPGNYVIVYVLRMDSQCCIPSELTSSSN